MKMGSLTLYASVFLCLVSIVYGQINSRFIPVIQDVSILQDIYLEESFAVGASLGRIIASDPDGTNVQFFLEGDGGEYFSIGRETGEVTLKKELDFETDAEIRCTIRVKDEAGQEATENVQVYVNDENDNEPYFDDYGIFKILSESDQPGTVISTIEVNDRDTKNSIITLECSGTSAQFVEACQMFELVQTGKSNKYWTGSLVLRGTLDYEQTVSYTILVVARDGKFEETNEIHVEVTDVNDSPPIFTQAGPSSILEEEPNGTLIQVIQAEDQDIDVPNEIRYELIEENTDRFEIDPITGYLANKVRIDYDSDDFPKDIPFELTIKARELQPNGALGDDPITTATVKIKVTVQDINDNTPLFDKREYSASVDENIASGANVPGLQMTVTDIDSGTFNSFVLDTLDHSDVFIVIPSEDSSSASATLVVRDGRKIDFEDGLQQYIIRVVARQNKVPNPTRSSTATVTINVNDVNDETPEFSEQIYRKSVPEGARGGFDVIALDATDREADDFGKAGIRYQLYGNIPEHFKIDEITGLMEVADCATPGLEPCIDYERKQSYSLIVAATDNKGVNGLTRSVRLIVTVLDENDVVPTIEDKYVRYIEENQRVTINPLRLDVIDPDTVGGPLTYNILGDSTGLWQVLIETDPTTGQQYGNITAIRPILYSDAPDQVNGQFKFAVEVNDQQFGSTADIEINVLDINNNAPEFTQAEFEKPINEDTPGETFVIRVTATDGDAPSTGNGVLDITIGSGGRGKFYARPAVLRPNSNKFEADIYTTPGATFNFDNQDLYDMTLVVRDRGTPQSKQGTGKLLVKILDINNKNPVIRPSFDSITVSENTPVDRSVHQVSATDADADKDLRYSFTATSAIDGNGAEVDFNTYDYRNLFRIEERTGQVLVNDDLDRDRAASITYSLLVKDVAVTPAQEGTGTLLIRILEYNDQPPQFNLTQYNVDINEELNINSFIQNLYCTDEDDKIESYSLRQDQPRRPTFFSFYSTSGAMIVESRIDYDNPSRIEKVELTAFCVDTGTPQLTATTKITVTVRNVNDNYPTFEQPLYRTEIPEGSGGGILNVNVRATDGDRGDYGNIRYALLNTNSAYDQFFSIDSMTGVITISNDAVFDRESSGFLGIQVQAYDSPNDENVRLDSSVPVYITISDINDNCPVFSKPFGYDGTVPESAEPDTSIIDILATDEDENDNARIVFSIKPGSGSSPDTETLFSVGRTNGRVLVRNLLRGKAGTYSFTLVATDKNGDNTTGEACATEVPVTVEIEESLNSAPRFTRPPQRDFVIYVLESQYEGMLVYGAKAVDENRGPNGVVDYHFMDGSLVTQNTAEFRINRVTGVIRAEVIFDREQRETYYLTLLAKDRGNPAASSETTLTVVILDVDDNDPMFPTKDGVVVPLRLPEPGIFVRDGQSPPANNGYLGRCTAVDIDSDEHSKIFYDILAAEDNVRDYIRVDRENCDIYLLQAVDFDTLPQLEFDILAYNEKNDDSVQRYRRAVNPSIQHVIVSVEDANDNAPKFTSTEYFGCIAYDAPFNKTILVVSATDVDSGDNARIRYSLAPGSLNQGFGINPVLGSIFNTKSFRDSPRNYQLDVLATDGTNNAASAKALVFVTSPSNVVKVKLNRPLIDVQPFSQQLVNTLTSTEQNEVVYACIDRLRNHVDDDGEESLTATDVFFAGVRSEGSGHAIIPADELVGIINAERVRENSPYQAISISDVDVEGDDDGFELEEDAVLAILIISIMLIVLALILFCIACYCIRKSDRKKKRKIRDYRHRIDEPIQEPVETSFNPVYHNMGVPQEPVYSSVQKVKPSPTPIVPVMIPAPENLQPLASEMEPPKNLEPAEEPDEDPVPVIVTEVLPEESAPPQSEAPTNFQPEYEDRIETEVEDDLEPPDLPPPPPADEIEIVLEENLEPQALDQGEPTVINILQEPPVVNAEEPSVISAPPGQPTVISVQGDEN